MITPAGLSNLGYHVIELADAEKLTAHANAVQVRLSKLKRDEYDVN
jgi:histidinol dehydrogenase